ncbi:hypothetical protein FACS189440_12350 [Bacteroidia bacterium]|nr:hypothetical protein FACS189423_11040 [Bacteroidia bacterium]GHT48515.1 hypothetical protein FACS189440_12350 [Bacteroidia bacterium]
MPAIRDKTTNNIDSITLFYKKNNAIAQNTINYLLSIGVFEKPSKIEKNPLELALEDVKAGRVTQIKDINNFIEEVLQ